MAKGRTRPASTTHILALVKERKELRVEEIVISAFDLVHPGYAARKIRSARTRNASQRVAQGRNLTGQMLPRTHDVEDDVNAGKRHVILGTITSLVRNGTVERFERDGEKWVRYVQKTGKYVILYAEGDGKWTERARVNAASADKAMSLLPIDQRAGCIAIPLRYFVSPRATRKPARDTITVSRDTVAPEGVGDEETHDHEE